MFPLKSDIPIITITGSSGKTTTRELISSVLETRWKVLKTIGNKNLPQHTKQTIERYDPSHQAIVLELGMGKQGAGQRHCQYVMPNISVITNLGTAHYGNLGNSIQSTAKYKSALIKYMDPNGKLLINNDDENSKLLETESFAGQIITVGIKNNADYQASNLKYLTNGMSFEVTLDNKTELFFIPVFGLHNVNNALFAIAIGHQLHFSAAEIKRGLEHYKAPYRRLNLIQLKNNSLLIDDTVNANPQSVKAAVDVLVEIGKEKKKVAALGSMLELGEYTMEGHKVIGHYLAVNNIDAIYTFGEEAEWILKGAMEAGYPAEKVQHFKDRDSMHQALKSVVEPDSVILVKGSSLTKMYDTAEYLKKEFLFSLSFDHELDQNYIYLSHETYKQLNIQANSITLHFGSLAKELEIKINFNLELGKMLLPRYLNDLVSIPDLPYDFRFQENHLFLGPVIGLLVLPLYYNDPQRQLLRFSNYDQIKGLNFLFTQNNINMSNQTITGYYYNPNTKGFMEGTFPYPSAIFNRVPLTPQLYQHFKEHMGENIFNYPYGNTDKWTFWSRMFKYSKIRKHLPMTIKFRYLKNLLQMLNRYQSVYIKPTSLAGGHGILHVKKLNNGYALSDHDGDKVFLESREALLIRVKRNLVPNRTYVIQQAIPFHSDGKKIDFRVYFQKDSTRNWKYSGMETKVAKEGSIISNSKNREKILPGETALQNIYHLNETQLAEKINEITQLSVEVLKVMENSGSHLADAAIDLVIDRHHRVWLLEVQLNYAAEIKANRTEDERRVLPHILPTPFEYAKALTGF